MTTVKREIELIGKKIQTRRIPSNIENMIKQISISNYKSVVNTTFPLTTFNVIIGANGCGKSNILEAIALAAAANADKLDYEYFANRGIRVVDPRFMLPAFEDIEAEEIQIQLEIDSHEPLFFKIRYNKEAKPPRWEEDGEFFQKLDKEIQDQRTELLGWFESLSQQKEISPKTKQELIHRINNLEKRLNDLQQKNSVKKIEFFDKMKEIRPLDASQITLLDEDLRPSYLRVIYEVLNGFVIYSLEESVLRKPGDDKRLYPLGRHGEGLFAHLKDLSGRENGINILREINENLEILDWFDGMVVPENQLSQDFDVKLRDRYIDETISYFDQRSTNEGFLYLLFYLTLIISDETPSFFAIENIDASFNPKLCREVVRRLTELAKKHGKQIIATTHNPSVLDGLDVGADDQELLVVRRNIDGYTKVNKVEMKGKLSMSLSEAWLKGLLGGLPNNF